jgi:tetratricopeptide (TPR) repeat protein
MQAADARRALAGFKAFAAHSAPNSQLLDLALTAIAARANNPSPESASATEELIAVLGELLHACGHREITLALFAALQLQTLRPGNAGDFHNAWTCARWAGTHCFHGALPTAWYLEYAQQLATAHPQPAAWILMGNALRRLGRFEEGLTAYRDGLARHPENPFLALRMANLLLALGRHRPAQALITPIAQRWPRIRERMFILPPDLPEPDTASAQANAQAPARRASAPLPTKRSFADRFVFPALPPIQRPGIWLICADPVYIERHGPRLVQSITASNPGLWHLHCHVIRTADAPLPTASMAQIAALAQACTFSERVLAPWDDAATAGNPLPDSHRRARYACERLLVLPGLLRQVSVPVLCSDIDLECLDSCAHWQSSAKPTDLALYGGGDAKTEPWETFNASLMLANPSPVAIRALQTAGQLAIEILECHPDPWFADQVALHRIATEGVNEGTQEGATGITTKDAMIRVERLNAQLLDHHTPASAGGGPRFKTHHASWQNNSESNKKAAQATGAPQ